MPSKIPLSNKPLPAPDTPCPCGSEMSLDECCLPFITGKDNAPTAETLMRSRYTAHTLLAIDYLWATWSPDRRLRSSKEDIYQWASSCDWLGLQILGTKRGESDDNEGIVEFMALFRQGGQVHQHHEISTFKRVLDIWLYVDHI